MNKAKIKIPSSWYLHQKLIVIEKLEKSGLKLGDIVGISLEKLENERGKMTYHLIAEWDEYSCVKGGMVRREKIEEINKYFSAELFAYGIIQRADYIKADVEDIKEYLRQFGGRSSIVHPALYSKWLESKKVA